MNRANLLLIGIIGLVVAAMVGLFALGNQNATSKIDKKGELVRAGSHQKGEGTVQLVEFGDFQCPACASMYPVVEQLLKENEGKVKFTFRNFPITQIHPNATAAHNAAESAGEQGKYWEYYAKLYENQQEWSSLPSPIETFERYASEVGIDPGQVRDAVQSQKYRTKINQGVSDGTALGVQSTPTFFVNGKKIERANYTSLRDAINEAAGQQ